MMMSLFHWGPIPWGFYAVLAVCFGFSIHVIGSKKQRFSEACRPILGSLVDRFPGKLIDILAVVALIAGCATTFSVATPLLSEIVSRFWGISSSNILTVCLLLIVCGIYTTSALHGMKGVKHLSGLCMYIFIALMLFVLCCGGETRFIVENGFSSLGRFVQNFWSLSTWTDPLRLDGFPQRWTSFYWAYWIVWCVAAPFFMGSISKGRTIRQVIFGSYSFGMGATFCSFVIFGNYGLGLQMSGKGQFLESYASGKDLYEIILSVVDCLPFARVIMLLLLFAMLAFYATSFDSITLVACAYSSRNALDEDHISKKLRLFWAILLIVFPIVLLFNESSMSNLQTVSMIAAFPLMFVIILIIASFLKEGKKYTGKKG